MDGYGRFCPIAKAAEVFDRRWTLLVLRELVAGSDRFNDIHRGVPPGLPPDVTIDAPVRTFVRVWRGEIG